MKKLLFNLSLFLVTLNFNAQTKGGTESVKNDTTTLNLNLNDITNKIEETLEKGKYKIIIKGDFEENLYTINIKKQETTVIIDPLEVNSIGTKGLTDSVIGSKKIEFKEDFQFEIKNRSKFELTVHINNKSDGTLFREIKVIYKSKNNKKWVSSLGVASAFLINRDTYRSVKQTNTTVFNVERDGSKQQLQIIPLMQFSFIDIEKDNGFVPTAGLGFDTENISAFFGGSYYFGQNIFLTGGFALHKQKRLNNLYKENQELTEAVDESILNKEYYRFNPFISLTYRLSSNIFKN